VQGRADVAVDAEGDGSRRVAKALLRDPEVCGCFNASVAQVWRKPYLNVHQEFRSQRKAEKESINDNVVFELIKQVEINVDYILMLVERFRDPEGDGDDKESARLSSGPSTRAPRCATRRTSSRSSSSRCRPPRKSTMRGQRSSPPGAPRKLDRVIEDEGLDREATRAFVEAAFRDGGVQSTGAAITQDPPTSVSLREGRRPFSEK
jgi:type I restriction enzyme, R subunit